MAKRSFKELEDLVLLEQLKPLDLRDQNLINEYAQEKAKKTRPCTSYHSQAMEIDPEKERREREEEEAHAPFSKRARTDQENYAYIAENKEKAEEEQIQRAQARRTEASTDSNIETTINNLKITDTKQKIKYELLNQDEEAFDSDNEIYKNPEFNLLGFSNYPDLPIKPLRHEIIHYLEKSNIIIIQGNTGCGKTTQVPQMILDHAANLGRHCNICVTQPRRLAAVSVCKRVCDERKWRMGSICGFKFQTERAMSPQTRILYLTTGSLIQSLISNENYINNYTHIILDEIHERDIDTDLIILLMYINLLGNYKGKVISSFFWLNLLKKVNFFLNFS